jgi:hypothetical protein
MGSFHQDFAFLAPIHLLPELLAQRKEANFTVTNNYLYTCVDSTSNAASTDCSNDQRPKSLHPAVDDEQLKWNESAWLSAVNKRKLETSKCIIERLFTVSH